MSFGLEDEVKKLRSELNTLYEYVLFCDNGKHILSYRAENFVIHNIAFEDGSRINVNEMYNRFLETLPEPARQWINICYFIRCISNMFEDDSPKLIGEEFVGIKWKY